MRSDQDAVGGFFEDLPVLAFVLAGVMSVAGTACWTNGQLSETDDSDALGLAAARLAADVVMELRGDGALPSIETVRSANLSLQLAGLTEGLACLVSVWCIHPALEPLLVVGVTDSDPEVASSGRVLMNASCVGGIVSVLEVRVLVWETHKR